MQKIRSFLSFLLSIVIFLGIFQPVWVSFAWKESYDYSEYSENINTSSENTIVYKNIHFNTPRTSFALVFSGISLPADDDMSIEWIVDGRIFSRHLDLDDRPDVWEDIISTFPFVTSPRMSMDVRIISKKWPLPAGIRIITSNQSSIGRSLIWDPDISRVSASSSPYIVSRAEWGADESLRYIPDTERQRLTDEWIARGKIPKTVEITSSQQEKSAQDAKEYNDIILGDIENNISTSITRYDGIHKLRWPITRTKKVSRIVLHHTSEELKQDADDMTLLRAIYLYHTKTKWWWDIGYNFVVWQRGVIYEGRAWGDYVAWAHAYGNNMWTIGISLMGNYSELHLNRNQKEGMIEAITYVAEKYGINLKEDAIWAKVCGKSETCIWKPVTTKRLLGHRDIWATDCPGENLYDILPELRSLVVWKVWNREIVYNTEKIQKDPLDPEDIVKYRVKDPDTISINPPSFLSFSLPRPSRSLGWKSIKIKLSYPDDTITLSPATAKKLVLRLDKKILPLTSTGVVNVSLTGSNTITTQIGESIYTGSKLTMTSDIVRISSWSRVPAWDSSRRYNDNLFRWNIIIRNNSGKLLVVNELPIEDYIRWLGEVSDSDLTEKIKTILVSARTYAYYYIDPKHRKYNTPLYDGSDNPDEFQKYLWYGYEMRSPNVANAVKNTLSEVITFEGELIKAWYFSSSDGKTRSYKEYCESNGWKSCVDIPYLQSVDDPAWLGKTRAWHGVGISGIWATYWASQWKTYQDIITYYLQWVEIKKQKFLK